LYFAKRPAEIESCPADFTAEIPSCVTISAASISARGLTMDAAANDFLASTSGTVPEASSAGR
jgi:hypothetical protein